MRLTSKNISLLLAFMVLLVQLFTQATRKPLPPSWEATPSATIAMASPSGSLVKVTKVVDGDTIKIETGETVRYIGMNTPETVDPRRPVQCFGHEASAKNKELVEGKQVLLEKDVSNTDKYGRLLRYVYLDGVMVNEKLVAEGYAQVDTYPPDVKYKDRFVAAQQEAKNNKKGLWSSTCNNN